MNKLEEEYKNRFKNLGSLQGIDPDQLWAGISENIESSPMESIASKNNNNNIIKWSGLLLLLFLIGGFLCYNFNSSSSKKVALPIQHQKSSNDPLPYPNQKAEIHAPSSSSKNTEELNAQQADKKLNPTNFSEAKSATQNKNFAPDTKPSSNLTNSNNNENRDVKNEAKTLNNKKVKPVKKQSIDLVIATPDIVLSNSSTPTIRLTTEKIRNLQQIKTTQTLEQLVLD